MLSLTKIAKTKTADVLKKAKAFFGPGGFGLKIMEEDASHIYLEGGGGGVNMVVKVADTGTQVDLETREWEIQAKDFFASLK